MCRLLFAWLLLSYCAALAQTLEVEAALPPSYPQGGAGAVTFGFRLDDPEAVVAEAVLYLNVIRLHDGGGYSQAAHRIFASAQAEPDIFQQVLSGEALRAGIRTTVGFQLQRRARPGRYALVLQLFSGRNTDPHRVRVEDRIGFKLFRFRLVED